MLTRIRTFFRNLLHRSDVERELHDEVESYVELLAAEQIAAGMEPAEARRRARLQLDGAESVKEQVRAVRPGQWLEHILQDLRYAMRGLRRAPGFTLVAVLTLAIGIGANTAVFSVVNTVLLTELPYERPEQLLRVAEAEQFDRVETISYATLVDLRDQSRTLASLSAVRGWSPALTGTGDTELLRGMRVSSSFFGMLRVKPMLGRDFLPEEDAPERRRVVILSYNLWRQKFNSDPAVVGRTIDLNQQRHEVVGVLPPEFKSTLVEVMGNPIGLWSPLGYAPNLPYACRTCRHLQAIGRLRDGVTPEQAREELNTLLAGLRKQYPTSYGAEMKVATLPAQELLRRPMRPALRVLMLAVAMVLLIACANVASLLLARGAARQREVAIRRALGASRARLFVQWLTESMVLAGVAGGLGLLIAAWATSALMAAMPPATVEAVTIGISGRVLLFTLASTVLTALIFGAAPAWQNSHATGGNALKETGAVAGRGRAMLRKGLVVAEVALTAVLVAGAGLMLRSVALLVNVDPGLNPRSVLTFNTYPSGPQYDTDEKTLSFYRQVLEQMRGITGVQSVALTSQLPLSGDGDLAGTSFRSRPVENASERPSIRRYFVSPEYFETLEIPLVRGRLFASHEFGDQAPVALVNETAARIYFNGDAIGEQVLMGDATPTPTNPWRTIVGVVRDTKQTGLDEPVVAQIYLPVSASGLYRVLARTQGDPRAIVGQVRDGVWKVDRNQPVYNIDTVENLLAHTFVGRRFTLWLLAGFGGVALLLAAIGIYGLISYSVAQRTQEFGVRLALGARGLDLLRMVLGQGFRLIAIGAGLGLAGSLLLAQGLKKMLFSTSPADPLTYALAFLVLALTALIAIYLPARRAMRLDPMAALRYE